MKHLLMIAIGCTSLASLIAAAPPARSQSTKFTCPPPFIWVDAKDFPYKPDPRLVQNGKVRVYQGHACNDEPPKKIKSNPPHLDDFDGISCSLKTKKCVVIPADPAMFPGVLPRRANPRKFIPASSEQIENLRQQIEKLYLSTSSRLVLKSTRILKQNSGSNGIFEPNDLKEVVNTKIKPWHRERRSIAISEVN